MASALSPEWQVIAPDQRGHGDSQRAREYTRAGYLADLADLLVHRGIDRAVFLGHCPGAINAFHLASERPDLVEALINVDTAVDLPDHGTSPPSPSCSTSPIPLPPARNWPPPADSSPPFSALC
ncbi:alpha/beta hydrolase [Streptomyces sp. NBC_00503]|nr:alpha/beta fold hydrolase [Streptomyces sp. NBC_00503]WUD85779.1 alpha/beta hydrolase [Streptomyces sp. NBC_00503]